METVLQGTDAKKGEGSWVYTDQGVAADKGFNHVSKYWYPQTKSFEEGIEQVEQLKLNREDIIFDAKHVKFNVAGDTLSVDIGGRKFAPNNWSARQLCNWFGVPQTVWTYYTNKENGTDDIDVPLYALNKGKEKLYGANAKPKSLLFRTYKDGTLRGVMSDGYSIVDNTYYLRLLEKYIPGGRLSHWKGDADTLYGNVLIPDTIRTESDSDYGGMLSISNCEIGRRVVSQIPSIFRAICMNGCIWGETNGVAYTQRHRGIDFTVFAEEVRKNIDRQIPLLTTKTVALLETHKMKAEVSMAALFAAIAKKNALTSEVVTRFSEDWGTFSNEKTAFGVIDAVTRAGQAFTPDVWVKCDEIGGDLLNGGEAGWSRLTSFAKSLTEKEIGKVYGIAL